MITARRFLVVQCLMLWQGGFLFYAAVVVPTGTEALGSSAAQGVVTARVTDAMNAIAVFALAVLALDLRLSSDVNARRITIRWWCWGVAFVAQCLLFYFHDLLDAFMDRARTRIVIGPPFRPVHRMYLWTITVQWFVCLVFVWFTIRSWRSEDRFEPKTAG